jgi:hypothetical protein
MSQHTFDFNQFVPHVRSRNIDASKGQAFIWSIKFETVRPESEQAPTLNPVELHITLAVSR